MKIKERNNSDSGQRTKKLQAEIRRSRMNCYSIKDDVVSSLATAARLLSRVSSAAARRLRPMRVFCGAAAVAVSHSFSASPTTPSTLRVACWLN
jgi:hypothetical protein